jgi:AcrR family transcriptional regulator
MPRKVTTRRTQAQRTSSMRMRLIGATIESLVERGYAHTTTVEVCRRAGVTRGALLHHFEDLSALFEASLEWLYDDMGRSGAADAPDAATTHAGQFIEQMWSAVAREDFKAVIEIWLAARNDTALAQRLQAAISRLGATVSPELNPDIRRLFGGGARAISYFLLVRETMIGMALGRAVTPGGELGHERRVLDLLAALAPSPKVSRSSI